MKKYPKVPRYDHPVVNKEIFSHPDTILLEKFDGANSSFMLYHDDFHNIYSDKIQELEPKNGELVIFSKNQQFLESETDKHIRGTYGDLIDYLVNTVDKEKIKEQYDNNGVLLYYTEYMMKRTITEYDDNMPIAIGFDVYNIESGIRQDCISTPENRFREEFIHFLNYEKSRELLENIGITYSNKVPFDEPLEPESFEVPYSSYGDIKSEGVIIRNDTLNKRYKLRSPFFMEIQKKSSTMSTVDIESEEDILYTFCPEIRIRKMIHKMIQEEDYELSKSIIEDLHRRVNEDMWSEEFHEIMKIDAEINPSKLYPMVANKCVTVVEKMIEEKN